MKTTGTFLQSTWVAMLILVSTFLFGAISASAQGHLSSSKQEITLEAKSGVEGVSTTVVITNTSSASLSVNATLSGGNASLFAVTPVEFTLEAGAKKEITVKFSLINSTVGRTIATLTFSVGDSIPLKIPLIGIKSVLDGDKTLKSDTASLPTPAAAAKGNNGSTSTSTDVRSPTSTSTEVRSPTSTSTQAHTSGNVTVTGGAGAGATTTVNINTYSQPGNKSQGNLLSEWVNTLGQTVQRTIDTTGNIVEHTLDTTGKVLNDKTVGRVLDLPVINQTTNAAGQTVKQVRDNTGAVVEYTLDNTGKIINTRIVSKATGVSKPEKEGKNKFPEKSRRKGT